MAVKEASGARITAGQLETGKKIYSALDYGAQNGGDPCANTAAINRAIEAAAAAGGGTVTLPAGEYKSYTIRLKSGVNLRLERGCVLRAARTQLAHSYETQTGEGGNYGQPEVNRYVGLQDHGHSYFENSLIYGADLTDVMICGEGLIDGSCFDEEGYRQYVLLGGDPQEPKYRNARGNGGAGEWFGNKAIALVRCENVVLKDFSLVIGGHFAIIAEGVRNLLAEDILVDTTRDAFDVDCCQDVTVRRSVFNSLTDDALVMKASFGAGKYLPLKNVLIEDCKVSGYDAGSVYAGVYTREKLVAADRGGPTGRVKLGTESSCGYEQVTVRRVRFDRSRGFALEAVDGSDLKDILFEDCEMDNISSSPIFVRAGERGRFPVTGNSREELNVAAEGNVRLDNRGWVLPDAPGYDRWPAKRWTPSYRREQKVCIDGHSAFTIVNQTAPVHVNEANLARPFREAGVAEEASLRASAGERVRGKAEQDGSAEITGTALRRESGTGIAESVSGQGSIPVAYGKKYDEAAGAYVPDWDAPLADWECCCRANACGSDHMARVSDIEIRNVKITNADPRYPLLLMGLADSPLRNITLENVQVEFRGGISMEQAVEQRQLNTNWEYTQFGTRPGVQSLPWLVNTFFLKNEGLLPRADWDAEQGCWRADPYNVPELPEVYPEPENWGILPAYGLYARHVQGLRLSNVSFAWKLEDGRHAVVLDDVDGADLSGVRADICPGVEQAAVVSSSFRRPTGREYVPHQPYHREEVRRASFPPEWKVRQVELAAPAPGTPQDEHYAHPTVPSPENGYRYAQETEACPLPLTVYRPFFAVPAQVHAKAGESLRIPIVLRDPASEVTARRLEGKIYGGAGEVKDFSVAGIRRTVEVRVERLPEGAVYQPAQEQNEGKKIPDGYICWTPAPAQVGRSYTVQLCADDGVLPEHAELELVCVTG